MVANLIEQYLDTHKRIIIPELGTFIKKDGGEVVFVEFLRSDDGQLKSLIAEQLSLDGSSSAQVIGAFVESVKSALGQNGKFIFGSLGTLVKDENGLLKLQQGGIEVRKSETVNAEPEIPHAAPDADSVKAQTAETSYITPSEPNEPGESNPEHITVAGVSQEKPEIVAVPDQMENAGQAPSTPSVPKPLINIGEEPGSRQCEPGIVARKEDKTPEPTDITHADNRSGHIITDLEQRVEIDSPKNIVPGAGRSINDIYSERRSPTGSPSASIPVPEPVQPRPETTIQSRPRTQQPVSSRKIVEGLFSGEDQPARKPVRETTKPVGKPLNRPEPKRPSRTAKVPQRKRTDLVMLIAIAAAIIAIAAMVYGYRAGSDPISRMQPTSPQELVQPAQPDESAGNP